MNLRRLAVMFVLLTWNVLYAEQGWADAWQQSISSKFSTGYDTNPAMFSASPGGAWLYLLEPSYTLARKIGEDEIKTGLDVRMSSSSNTTLSPSRVSPTGFLSWLGKNDTGEYIIFTQYSEASTRDTGIDATGQVPASSTRTSRKVTGNWSKELGEFNTLSADGSYEGVSYKGGLFIDYSTESAGLKFTHAVNEQISPFVRVSGYKFVPASGEQSSHRDDAILGMNWNVQNIETTMQIGKSFAGGNNSELVGSATAKFTGEKSQIDLASSRLVLPSGRGGFVTTDQFKANWSYSLSENNRTGIDFERRNNNSIVDNITSAGITSGAWEERNLTSLWKIKTYYHHVIYQGGGVASASSNTVGLTFTYDNPVF